MKGMIAAVIAGANQVMEMDWHNGAWNNTFVCVPIQINPMPSERSD
jgi:hypothetical protein